MNILSMKLEDFYNNVMNDADNLNKVSAEIKKSQQNSTGGNYEWARFICLVYGKMNNTIDFSKISREYLSEFYTVPGAVQHALFTAIEGNIVDKSVSKRVSYTKKEFEESQLSKFKNGTYKDVQTMLDLLNAIELEINNKQTGGLNSLKYITNIKAYFKGLVINTSGKVINNMSVEALIENAVSHNKKQIVLTGAPGTGKTFSVKKYVANYIDSQSKNHNRTLFSEFVQFHPSYDYSDFVEGLRPIQKNGQMVFERIDGVFKCFCRKVVDYNIKNNLQCLNNEKQELKETDPLFFFIIDEINRADLSKVFGELMYCLEDSYRGQENRIPTQYSNLETYDPEKNVHLNDKEQDKNGISWSDDFYGGFFIPQNVIIVGTMNDIDKSVEAFDFALRRRFEWIEVKAGSVMQDVLDSMYNKSPFVAALVPKIDAMNELISGEEGKKFRLTSGYHIGPAYFKGIDCTNKNTFQDSLEQIFNNNIASILREYTRGKDEESVRTFIKECAEKLGVEYAG